MPSYIKWDAPGVEVIQPGEENKIKMISGIFDRFQAMNFNEHHHCFRGTHLKTQGCVVGKFTVHANLPAHLAQGMFAKPGTYDVIMRYSSLPPKLVPDNVPTARGVGMKVFGVEGEKMWGEEKKTQDWTFNNYPVLEFREAQTTYELFDCMERNWNDFSKVGEEFAKREDAELATLSSRLPRQHMVAMSQYSQSAYRFGDYVAKFGLFPLGEEQTKLQDKYIPDDAPMNILSKELQEFHLKNKVSYSFCAQLLQNLEDQPVEDIGVEWDSNKYPFERLATLEFEPQDSWIPSFRVWWDDRITCNPWHGLKVHQPLGSTNRVRRVVYAASRKLRLQMNGYEDYVEPTSLLEVPVSAAVTLSTISANN